MELTGYSSFWKAVIRPPKCVYAIEDLGPRTFELPGGMRVTRTDLEIKNHEGKVLQCSHYEPNEFQRDWENLPCVVYLHGNSSARVEAIESVMALLPENITVFCFDFAGCGMSEGEYISLGWWEREDLGIVIDYLRKERRVSTIGLWGRSMGAATALLYADRDPSIAGMVLDSPFSKLSVLVDELAKQYTKIPNFLVKGALKLIRSSVKSKANFDLMQLNPIDNVDKAFIPALFAHGIADDFIQPHHSEKIHAAYAGDKALQLIEGDHNSQRPQDFTNSAMVFLRNTLQVNQLLTEETRRERPKPPQSENREFAQVDDMDLFFTGAGLMGRNPPPPVDFDSLKNEGIELPEGFEEMDEELKMAILESIEVERAMKGKQQENGAPSHQ